jgi:hypothetical protein
VEAVVGNHRMRRAPHWWRAAATEPLQDESDIVNVSDSVPTFVGGPCARGASRRSNRAERRPNFPWKVKSDSGSVGRRLHQRVLTQRSWPIDQTAGFLVSRVARGKSDDSSAQRGRWDVEVRLTECVSVDLEVL